MTQTIIDDSYAHVHDIASMQSIPLDIRSSITQFLDRNDFYTLIRTCKSNLYTCRHYIRRLLSLKFAYLLHHNESKINIKHLMKIPLIDSITMNATNMPSYFAKTNESGISSKYIGIDRISGYGFISFWMKRVQPQFHRWKIITIVFNETDIHCIYMMDTSYRLTLKNSLKCRCNVAAINHLILIGKMKGILEDRGTWCLNHKWNECMFWIRVRGIFTTAFRLENNSTNCLIVAFVLTAIFIWLIPVCTMVMPAFTKRSNWSQT